MHRIWSIILQLFFKYKEVILYLVFGVLTTVINIAAYCIFAYAINVGTVISTIAAWIISVAFAYVTNKIFVFESKTCTFSALVYEITSFFGCRLFTGLMDLAIMYIFVDILKYNGILIKIISNVIVVVLNYIFSKIFIFSGKKEPRV